MKLKNLELENIRSYEKHSVSFPEGSTLLSGDIGSGKTSILLAIEFALFGLQPGQRGASLLRNGEKTGKVSLEFESGSDLIKVERTLKRGSKTVTQESSLIYINGDREELSTTELKTRILSILNYPPEFIKRTNLLYKFTVYSPQEEMKQIITEDPETRLNLLRHIFGIDKYRKVKENTQVLSSRLKEQIRFLQTRLLDVDSIKNEIEQNNQRNLDIQKIISEKNTVLQNIILQKQKYQEELSQVEDKIQERNKFERELEKSLLVSSSKKNQLLETAGEIEQLQKETIETEKPFSKEDLEKVLTEIDFKKRKLLELNKSYIALQSSINSIALKKQEDLEKRNRVFKIDLCPTCLQNVSESHKHNILNDTETSLVKAEKEIKKGQTELSSVKSLIEKETIELDSHYAEKSRLEILESKEEERLRKKQRLESLRKNSDSLNKDIDFLENQIKLLRDSLSEFSKYDNIYKAKQENLTQSQNQEKSIEIEMAELNKEKELLEKRSQILYENLEEKKLESQKLSKFTELEEWLSKTFTELIAFTERNMMFKLRQEFSKLFNKWFEMLVTDNLYVNLDENFTPVIMQGEFEIDYNYLSGGERTAVALAYRLALNQTINSIFSRIRTRNLVILDEPTDGFSERQLDKVREVLQELDLEQLIIVSHEQKVESFVDNIIRLKKEHQISKTI